MPKIRLVKIVWVGESTMCIFHTISVSHGNLYEKMKIYRIVMKREMYSALCSLLVICLLVSCRPPQAGRSNIATCTNGTSPTNIHQGLQLQGSLLLNETTQSYVSSYDGKTHDYITLLDLTGFKNYSISSISPGGKWLLVSQQKKTAPNTAELLLLFRTGRIERKSLLVPESDDHILRYFHWLNEQSFLGWTLLNGFYNYGIFEPLIPQWHPLELDGLTFYEGASSGISLSPDLSRILYVNREMSLILYDLKSGKTLLGNYDYDGINPVLLTPELQPSIWSSDGSMLAIPTSRKNDNQEENGIIVVDKSGKVIRSVYFENRPFGLSFSHNGKYLAFFEERLVSQAVNANRIPVIRMLEIASGRVFDMCVLGSGTDPTYNVETQTILWSPDDKYIAYNYGKVPPSQNFENRNGIIIQKLDEEEIWLIPSGERNYILLGWSPYQWKKPN